MKTMDLITPLKGYKNGWVAINKKSMKVIAHAKDFNSVSKKTQKEKDIFLMPVLSNYFGFVT